MIKNLISIWKQRKARRQYHRTMTDVAVHFAGRSL